MADESIFEVALKPTPSGEENKSFVELYVGEGKKYKDVEELAKAYHNADEFIPKLKSDMDALKEFTLAQFKNGQNRQPEPEPKPNVDGEELPKPAAPASPPKGGEENEVDLDERIRQLMEERDEGTRIKNNAAYTEEVMVNHFGTKEAAVQAVRAKAAELEVSPQWLADTAFRSPKAFLTTMGISEEKPRSHSTPNSQSDVNPRMLDKQFGGPKANTYAWYDGIRKTDPKRYWNKEFQAQMMSDAQRLGNDFFKR